MATTVWFQCSMASFCVRCGVVALNPLVGIVCRELSRRELAVVVCMQYPELVAALLLDSCLVVLDGVHCCRLGVKQDRPHVAGHVVDKEEEVAPSSRCGQSHWSAEVGVHELPLLLCSEVHLAREGSCRCLVRT